MKNEIQQLSNLPDRIKGKQEIIDYDVSDSHASYTTKFIECRHFLEPEESVLLELLEG